jgi:hypothetical protein
MQISDFISVIALFISAVAIYFCWANSRQSQKLSSAQIKTELLQKIDQTFYKHEYLVAINQNALSTFKDDLGFQDFMIENSKEESLNIFNNSIKAMESHLKSNNKFAKMTSDISERIGKLDIKKIQCFLKNVNRM